MTDNDSSQNNPQVPQDDDWLKAAADWWSDALQVAGKDFRRKLDADAKKPRPAPEPTPPTNFDRHFQDLVGPKLLNLIVALAPMITHNLYSFSEARTAVWRIARKSGAEHLSLAAEIELEDWIASELVARLDDPWPDSVVTPERLASITGEPREGD